MKPSSDRVGLVEALDLSQDADIVQAPFPEISTSGACRNSQVKEETLPADAHTGHPVVVLLVGAWAGEPKPLLPAYSEHIHLGG